MALRNSLKGPKPPKDVEERIKRGVERLEQKAPDRNICMEFVRGNQYLYTGDDGKVHVQATGTATTPRRRGKPKHRVRQVRNLIKPIVEGKVSAATQRVPAPEVVPTSSDPEDIAGARIAQKIGMAGMTDWGVRDAAKATAYYAIVADEGFAMAYWDTAIGPYIDDTEKKTKIGIGDVRIRKLSGNEVGWEPGVDFEDARWCFIRNARPIDELENDPEFLGGKLTADASEAVIYSRSDRVKGDAKNLVLTIEFFERPCPDYPEGRRFTIANGRQIFPEEKFPLRDTQGRVIDRQPMRRLGYCVDPDSDRPQGLVRALLDAQRTYNDSNNKGLEWKNAALAPQMVAEEGTLVTPPSDEPNSVVYVRVPPGKNIDQVAKWRQVPSVPPELFTMADRARMDMGVIASSNELPAGQIESGKEAETIVNKDAVAWQSFLDDLAAWYSGIVSDCLTLAQLHYTENRAMAYRGRLGWESTGDFKGAQIHNQVDARVLPGQIQPRTRESVRQEVMNYAQLGWVSPEVAMSAINAGTAEGLIDSYERDFARAAEIIKQIRLGTFANQPPRQVLPGEDAGPKLDPLTRQAILKRLPDGTPVTDPTGAPVFEKETELPGWFPRPFDNERVHKAALEDWMKSSDYDMLDAGGKEAANLYYQALLDLEAKKAQRAAMLQQQQAEQLGEQNAARPPTQSPLPSLPGQQT